VDCINADYDVRLYAVTDRVPRHAPACPTHQQRDSSSPNPYASWRKTCVPINGKIMTSAAPGGRNGRGTLLQRRRRREKMTDRHEPGRDGRDRYRPGDGRPTSRRDALSSPGMQSGANDDGDNDDDGRRQRSSRGTHARTLTPTRSRRDLVCPPLEDSPKAGLQFWRRRGERS